MAISERVKTVREHVKAENAGDLDAALATFKHPRYEYVATDEVYDGPEEVLAHWRELNRAFPDQQTEIVKLRRADDTVVMEGIFRGTTAARSGDSAHRPELRDPSSRSSSSTATT